MQNTYLRTFIQHVHALEKSGRLSEDESLQLRKHMKLLEHALDVKNIRDAERQRDALASVVLTILER